MVVRVPTATGSESYANSAPGRVVEGRKRCSAGNRSAASSAGSPTRCPAPPGTTVRCQPERLFEYDQTHILTLLGSYDLGRGWQVGGRFRYVSGNPYTPCLGGVLQAGAGVYACRSGALLSARMPPFHQLDLRVDKTWKFASCKLTTYLDVQNVYNRANPEAVLYNFNYTPDSLPIRSAHPPEPRDTRRNLMRPLTQSLVGLLVLAGLARLRRGNRPPLPARFVAHRRGAQRPALRRAGSSSHARDALLATALPRRRARFTRSGSAVASTRRATSTTIATRRFTRR